MSKTTQGMIDGTSGGERDRGSHGRVFDLPTENQKPLIDPEVGGRISNLVTQLESASNANEAAGIQAEITRLAQFASSPPVIKFELPENKKKP
jgi:hypothetical protein